MTLIVPISLSMMNAHYDLCNLLNHEIL